MTVRKVRWIVVAAGAAGAAAACRHHVNHTSSPPERGAGARRTSPPSARRALHLLVLVMAGSLWGDIVDTAEGIWGGLTGVAGSIREYVKHFVHDAIDAFSFFENLVTSAIRDLASLARGIAEQVGRDLTSFASLVYDKFDQWWRDMVAWVQQEWHTLWDIVWRDIVAPVIGAIYKVVLNLVDYAHSFIDSADAWFGHMFHAIFDPIWDVLRTYLAGPFLTLVHDLIDGAIGDIRTLWRWAVDLLHFVERDVIPFFAAIGSHLPDVIEFMLSPDLWLARWAQRNAKEIVHHIINDAGSIITDHLPEVESTLKDWLGVA